MIGVSTAARRARNALLFCGSLSLAGCVSNVPLEISSQFNPPHWPNWAENAPTAGSRKCNLVLAPIVDERLNPESLGTVNNQAVHSSDPTGWVRQAFETLARDPSITIQDSKSGRYDLVLRVDLLKAYVVNVTGETRSVNVVVRVLYSRMRGDTEEVTYRGTDDGVTWGGGQSESQTSFNIALLQIIDVVHRDVIVRCGASVNSNS